MVYHGISPDYTPHIESGLALLGDSCKDVAVCRSTSLSSWAWGKKWRANCFVGEERLISLSCCVKSQVQLQVVVMQGSSYRAIWAKKSPCECWLCLQVGPKRSSSHIVILNSSPMLPAYFCHVPFMKISTSCLLNSMLFIKYFESDFLEK